MTRTFRNAFWFILALGLTLVIGAKLAHADGLYDLTTATNGTITLIPQSGVQPTPPTPPTPPAPIPANCQIVPTTWQGSGVQIGITPLQTMNNGQQFAFPMTVPAGTEHSSQVMYPSPATVGKIIVVSTTACGFTTPVAKTCSVTASGNTPIVAWNTGTAKAWECPLVAGQTYYFNVRNATTPTGPDQCQVGTSCTYYFSK